jgi:hypothetical protein
MPKEDTDSVPPMARLYDVMQQRGKSIYSGRSSSRTLGAQDSTRSRNSSHSLTLAQRTSSNNTVRIRRTRSTTGLRSTGSLRNHPGEIADRNDCEVGRISQADVPPPPLDLQERKYTRSPLIDGSFASTADF